MYHLIGLYATSKSISNSIAFSKIGKCQLIFKSKQIAHKLSETL